MHTLLACQHVQIAYVNRLPSWTCSPPIPFTLYGHLIESFAFVSVFTFFVVPHWCWCETIKCVWQQVPSLPPVYGATQRLSQTNRLVQSSLDHFQNPWVPSGPVSEEQPTNGPFSVDSRWGGPASHSEELLVSPDTENESAFICQPSGLQWAFLCT